MGWFRQIQISLDFWERFTLGAAAKSYAQKPCGVNYVGVFEREQEKGEATSFIEDGGKKVYRVVLMDRKDGSFPSYDGELDYAMTNAVKSKQRVSIVVYKGTRNFEKYIFVSRIIITYGGK